MKTLVPLIFAFFIIPVHLTAGNVVRMSQHNTFALDVRRSIEQLTPALKPELYALTSIFLNSQRLEIEDFHLLRHLTAKTSHLPARVIPGQTLDIPSFLSRVENASTQDEMQEIAKKILLLGLLAPEQSRDAIAKINAKVLAHIDESHLPRLMSQALAMAQQLGLSQETDNFVMTDRQITAFAALPHIPKRLEEDLPSSDGTWGESDRDFIIHAGDGVTWTISSSQSPPEIYFRWPETLRVIDLPRLLAIFGQPEDHFNLSHHIPEGLIAIYRTPTPNQEKLVGIVLLKQDGGALGKTLFQRIGDGLVEVRNQPIDGYATFGQSHRSKSDWKRPILSWTGIVIVLAGFTHMTRNDPALEQIYISSLAAILAVIIWTGIIFISGKLSLRRALRIFIWPAIMASFYIGLRFIMLWLSNLN